MSRTDPRVWLGGVSLALVVALVVVDLGRTSPGPLSPSHSLAEGPGEQECAACHGGMTETMAEACSACHEAIAGQLAAATGFHGGLASGVATECGPCHLEHQGRGSRLVDERSFALAGVPDLDEYDHRGLGFELRGSHLDLACADCHARAHETWIRPGERRFLGLQQQCTSCHEDPHRGNLRWGVGRGSQPDCSACHRTDSFRGGARESFDHERWTGFVLEGAHASASCEACHVPGARAGGRLAPARGNSCGECHQDPHAGQFAASSGNDCARCHGSRDSFAATAFDHQAHSRFPLDQRHRTLACGECHQPWPLRGGGEAIRYRPLGTECSDCHIGVPVEGRGR